jgi:uncharacterized Zn-binding protein involved in type VI secretion
MAAAHRLGDTGTGHGCWPSRANSQASLNVFIESKRADRGWHRVGDSWESHCCTKKPYPCHASTMERGSTTVFVNKKPAARIGDDVACGSRAATGSGTVFAGG